MVEVAFMLPWIFFLFLAIFDFGFYAYALISVENGARAGALRASASVARANNTAYVCDTVLEELRSLPGIGLAAACNASYQAGTIDPNQISGQITVASQAVAPGPDGEGHAAQVTVTYRMVNLFPLPWFPKEMTFVRTVRMRI